MGRLAQLVEHLVYTEEVTVARLLVSHPDLKKNSMKWENILDE